MDRRHFLGGAAAAVVGVRLRGASKKSAKNATSASVLLISVEDVGAWMLGIYGNKSIQTPQLDLQARSGTRLINACAAAPAPDPSRESLLRGIAPGQAAGTHAAMGDLFRSHGYTVGTPSAPANALEQCTKATVDFLNAQAEGRPFFYTVNYAPLRVENVPDRCAQIYASNNFSDLGWVPASPDGTAASRDKMRDVVNSIRRAAAAVSYFDEQLPAIRGAIVQRKLYDSTIVILTGTSGNLLGRHGLWGDGRATTPPNMYEEVIRVPFFCSWPGQTPADVYRVEQISVYDVLPTLCDMTGVPAPAGIPGRSFAKVVMNQPFPKKEPWKNLAFAALDGVWMARDNRYKLLLREDGSGELFDLSADATEQMNRFDDGEYINVKKRLSDGIQSMRAAYR